MGDVGSESKKTIEEVNVEYFAIREKGFALEDDGKFKEAAETYYDAAKFADSHKMGLETVIGRFEESAEMFHKIGSTRAFQCYQDAIDSAIKEVIVCFVRICMEKGYKYEREFNDKNSSDLLYKMAEDLRHKYDIPHTCVLTEFDEDKYNAKEANDLLEEFYSKVYQNTSTKYLHASLCRHCIDAFTKVSKFVDDL
ncbi:hypothetical protein RF11_00188 [Thelohanellus kitauei]|uniref:Alpha-soluble NSF attachment protein n=1 Tax=Thelohanellus kitauei TaxID=669202 RepID=A0A0C2JLZ7_THEKT|nr:hypothetical protein RF11_00188 [Thelohanellus kitauei]